VSYHVHCCDEVDQESVEADAVERWLQSPEAEARLTAALRETDIACVPGEGDDLLDNARAILAVMRDSTPTP